MLIYKYMLWENTQATKKAVVIWERNCRTEVQGEKDFSHHIYPFPLFSSVTMYTYSSYNDKI